MAKRKRKRLATSSNDIRYSCELNLMDCSTAAFVNNRNVSHQESEKRCKSLIRRCEQLDYNHVAISHTAYGRLNLERDSVEQAFPKGQIHKNVACDVYRRINVVIEDPADIRIFTSAKGTLSGDSEYDTTTSKDKVLEEACEVLKGYDIVALLPKNESSFTSICQSARRADIIMLDYASGRGGRLPYTLKASDLEAASGLGLAFEVCYSPMLVDPSKRKNFIQTIRNFSQAGLSVKTRPVFILSSGSRTNTENSTDYGQLALRSYSDMVPILQEFAGLVQKHALASMTTAPWSILGRIRRPQNGIEMPPRVSISKSTNMCASDAGGQGDSKQKAKPEKLSTISEVTSDLLEEQGERDSSEDGDGDEDGFIAF